MVCAPRRTCERGLKEALIVTLRRASASPRAVGNQTEFKAILFRRMSFSVNGALERCVRRCELARICYLKVGTHGDSSSGCRSSR